MDLSSTLTWRCSKKLVIVRPLTAARSFVDPTNEVNKAVEAFRQASLLADNFPSRYVRVFEPINLSTITPTEQSVSSAMPSRRLAESRRSRHSLKPNPEPDGDQSSSMYLFGSSILTLRPSSSKTRHSGSVTNLSSRLSGWHLLPLASRLLSAKIFFSAMANFSSSPFSLLQTATASHSPMALKYSVR